MNLSNATFVLADRESYVQAVEQTGFDVTRTISIEKQIYLVDFIVHPLQPRNLLAVTSNLLIEVMENGQCVIIAGTNDPTLGCSFTPNNITFTAIIEIIQVDFSLSESYGSANTVLIADRGNRCVIAIELDDINGTTTCPADAVDLSDFDYNFVNTIPYPEYFPTFHIRFTLKLQVVYFTDYVMLISVRNSDPTLINMHEWGMTILRYYEINPYKEIAAYGNPIGGISLIRTDEKCLMTKFVDNSEYRSPEVVYNCPWSKAAQPFIFQGRTFMVNTPTKMNEVIWPFDHNSNPVVIKTKINRISTKGLFKINIVETTASGIWIYGRGNRAFTHIEPTNQLIATMKDPVGYGKHRIVRIGNDYVCGGRFISGELLQCSLEACAYKCLRNLYCKSFTYNSMSQIENLCSLHRRSVGKGVFQPGAECYSLTL